VVAASGFVAEVVAPPLMNQPTLDLRGIPDGSRAEIGPQKGRTWHEFRYFELKSCIFPPQPLAGVALASRFAHDENGYRSHKSAERDECLLRCFLWARITSATEKIC